MSRESPVCARRSVTRGTFCPNSARTGFHAARAPHALSRNRAYPAVTKRARASPIFFLWFLGGRKGREKRRNGGILMRDRRGDFSRRDRSASFRFVGHVFPRRGGSSPGDLARCDSTQPRRGQGTDDGILSQTNAHLSRKIVSGVTGRSAFPQIAAARRSQNATLICAFTWRAFKREHRVTRKLRHVAGVCIKYSLRLYL